MCQVAHHRSKTVMPDYFNGDAVPIDALEPGV